MMNPHRQIRDRAAGPLTLGAAMARGRQNNLDALRLAAALAVVVSHAWPLTLGRGAAEPLAGIAPVSLGGLAVLIFFFVSGVLVTHSAHRTDRGFAGFAIARIARIVPGLVAALIITAMAFAWFTPLAYDLTDAAAYVLRGLSLAALQHEIPGLFADNPYPLAANGPLWTLFYEVACYGGLAAVTWAGVLRFRQGWLAVVLLAVLTWTWVQVNGTPATGLGYRVATGAPLALAFVAGMLAWRLRTVLPLDWRIAMALLGVSAIAGAGESALPLFIVTTGYISLLLAYRTPILRIESDISYGIYIYGWPVAQMIVAVAGPMDPVILAAASACAVLPVAYASWHLIERPALAGAAHHLRKGLVKAEAR